MARNANPRGLTLSAALLSLTADTLRAMMARLSTPKPRPTRKADMIEAIERRLAGESLPRIWDGLDEIQKFAVSEVLYGMEGGFNPNQFKAKYGAMPEGLSPLDSRGSRDHVSLRLFLYSGDRYADSPMVIPAGLAERLLAFVPPPPETTLVAEDELPESVEQHQCGHVPEGEKPTHDRVELIRRDMERAAPQDLLSVLGLIDRGRIAVSATTRRASSAAVQRIAEVLDGGDFFDPSEKKKESWEQVIGPIKAFAWPWLVQAAKLAEPRGSKLALTKAGHIALGKPPAETLRRLWEQWTKNTLHDEFSRIDDIKGQHRGKGRRAMTAASNRRPVIAEALAQCPVGRWVRFDDFSRFMQASSFDFSVTRDPWRLYITDAHYGSLGYADCHDWPILQGRYLLCLLLEYAATLGLIDVAYTDPDEARPDFRHMWGTDDLTYLSRYDGLQYFRLNPLGAYCLSVAETYEPGAPPALAALTVFPDLRLHAHADLSPDEKLLLNTYAEAESDDIWRLDRDKTLAAIEGGHAADELREYLAVRDDQPLPETVEGFLRNAERRARALKARGMALLIECADVEVAARLATDERTAKLCLRAGERHLVVRTKSEGAFRKAVRELGYGMPQT